MISGGLMRVTADVADCGRIGLRALDDGSETLESNAEGRFRKVEP
jgi:hypothetical protein